MASAGTFMDLRKVAAGFDIPGDFAEGIPFGSGHINDTFAATFIQNGIQVRYIHQRINHRVLKDPLRVMENIARVTRHQRQKLEASGVPDASRRALTLVHARDGKPYWTDPEGAIWRTYLFIENAKTFDVIEKPAQALAAARAFGDFQRLLADLPGGRLHESIPDFHNTPLRLEALAQAAGIDSQGRASGCAPELGYALARKAEAGHLLGLHREGAIPERVTHNDTKLNNVMLDDVTGEGICVIDLDTVMPGLAPYDFGDMVRSSVMPVPEDEKDLEKVQIQWALFEALARGYLGSAGAFLNKAERDNLAFAGWLLTFETGIRFLTDHLSGDTYYKIHREGHNLDRARTQLRLAQQIEQNLGRMNRIVADSQP